MKINEYIAGTKANAYTTETKKTGKGSKVNGQSEQSSEATSGDKVALSDRSREIARVQDLVQAAPETRAEKVADIKSRIDSGTYNVKAELVADAMLRGAIDEKV
jgi:negative regulator of flagellin synthesis FlgM